MDLNFASVINELGPDFALRFINGARVPADYVLTGILPEELRGTYNAKGGAMTIRSTMAGLVGMDSAYPPGGNMGGSSFNEALAKVAQEVPLPEKVLRTLHELLAAMGSDAPTDEAARNTVLNFTDKVLTQAQFDTAEWMRGRALSTGALQWTFGDIVLNVDYGFPAANLFSQRTGTDGYAGSTSKFWTDWYNMLSILKGQLRLALAHPNTINALIYNAANKLTLLEQDFTTGTAGFVQFTGDASTGPRQASSDARDRARIVGYGLEGDVIDPDDPESVVGVPMIPEGLIVCIGNPVNRGMTVGLGSALESETNPLRVGYTHIGPTTENGGRPGRYAQVYTPESRPMEVRGRTACNLLPVIEAPDKIVVLSTVMP